MAGRTRTTTAVFRSKASSATTIFARWRKSSAGVIAGSPRRRNLFPDLVVIDGGRGQIGAALKAFLALDLTPPPLIGLAKKHETIIFPDDAPAAESPAESSRIECPAATARRSASIREHVQCEAALEENSRERARRFRWSRSGAPRPRCWLTSAASIGCARRAWRRSRKYAGFGRAGRGITCFSRSERRTGSGKPSSLR